MAPAPWHCRAAGGAAVPAAARKPALRCAAAAGFVGAGQGQVGRPPDDRARAVIVPLAERVAGASENMSRAALKRVASKVLVRWIQVSIIYIGSSHRRDRRRRPMGIQRDDPGASTSAGKAVFQYGETGRAWKIMATRAGSCQVAKGSTHLCHSRRRPAICDLSVASKKVVGGRPEPVPGHLTRGPAMTREGWGRCCL